MAGENPVALLTGASLVEVSGVALELRREGQGRPLLYLHGIDGLEASAGIIGLLARDFEVHAPSHPGFGASPLPAGFSSVDDLAYLYLDYVEAHDLRDLVVVGASFGGWIAAELMIKGSDRPSAAVLAAPFGIRTATRRERHVADIFMMSPSDLSAALNGPCHAPATFDSLSNEQLERALRNREALSHFGWSPYLYDPKLEQRLHRIKAPTLVAWGEDDRIASPAYGRAFADAIPGAALKTLPQCGHRIYADRPRELCDLIRTISTGASS